MRSLPAVLLTILAVVLANRYIDWGDTLPGARWTILIMVSLVGCFILDLGIAILWRRVEMREQWKCSEKDVYIEGIKYRQYDYWQ